MVAGGTHPRCSAAVNLIRNGDLMSARPVSLNAGPARHTQEYSEENKTEQVRRTLAQLSKRGNCDALQETNSSPDRGA
jgi:hypothetical protein